MTDEAERSLHDALSVLSQTVKETRIVLGGGCSEMLMSVAVEESQWKEGDRGRGVCTRSSSNPDDFSGQRWVRFI
jgi:chaperonin GroEL (HSP60 family)